MTRWPFFLLSLATIALAAGACGDAEPEPDAEQQPRVLPVQRPVLHVVVQRDPALLIERTAAWAENQRVELRFHEAAGEGPAEELPRSDGLDGVASLVEVDGSQLAALNAARRLSPIPESAIPADSLWTLGNAPEPVGFPWLIGPSGLVVDADLAEEAGLSLGDGLTDWEQLATLSGALRRLTGSSLGLSSEEAGLHNVFIPLARSAGGGFVDPGTGEPGLVGPQNTEALDFLMRISEHALRGETLALEGALRARRIGALPMALKAALRLQRAAPQARYRLVPYPPSDSEGEAQLLLRIRYLVVPRGGAHPDLARSLARHLLSPSVAGAIADQDDSVIPAHRGAPLDPESAALLGARGLPGGSLPWTAAWPQLRDHMDQAVANALELRRTPEAALVEADRNLRSALASGDGRR